MPSFNIHTLSSVLSPKAVIRRRRQNKSSSSSISSVSSSSSMRSVDNVSIADSSSERSSCESFATSSTSQHGITSLPRSSRKIQAATPLRLSPNQSPRLRPRPSHVDLCGFFPTHNDDDEDAFKAELAVLEPRPTVVFDGVLETLDQVDALPISVLKI